MAVAQIKKFFLPDTASPSTNLTMLPSGQWNGVRHPCKSCNQWFKRKVDLTRHEAFHHACNMPSQTVHDAVHKDGGDTKVNAVKTPNIPSSTVRTKDANVAIMKTPIQLTWGKRGNDAGPAESKTAKTPKLINHGPETVIASHDSRTQQPLLMPRRPGGLRCKRCHKVFPNRTTWLKHGNNSCPNFRCQTCNQGFLFQSDCKRHELTHGTDAGRQQEENGDQTGIIPPSSTSTKDVAPLDIQVDGPSDAAAVEWSQGCIYSCQKCTHFTSKNKGAFKGHLKAAHGMSVNEYRDEFESVVTQGKFHLCLICGSKVVHDEKYLVKHLKMEHDISLGGYYREKVMKARGAKNPEAECRLCNKFFPTLEDFAIHIGASHTRMSVKKYTTSVASPLLDMEVFRCKVCPAILIGEAGLVKHLAREHDMKDVEVAEYNSMECT